jgi:Mg-chelatase subunit ChlD
MISPKFLSEYLVSSVVLLILFSSVVVAVDLDELYDNPDVIPAEEVVEASENVTEVPEAVIEVSEELPDTPGIDVQIDTPVLTSDSFEEESSSLARLLGESVTSGLAKDVVIVLDNSGSMKKNDPDFLATQAVSEFISGLDSQTRISIVIFDQNVSLAVPLTPLTLEARGTVVDSLKKVNYKGLFTDSPAAIERAIYELKNNGRENAQKSIVFMTDGIVDTGNAEVDLEKSKWLKEDLAADAADESIKVFAVAFTEAADFQLIQSIAQKTDGEYYRALVAADLQKVFKQINVILNKEPEPVAPIAMESAAESSIQATPVVQQPVIIEVPVQTAQTMGKEERLRSTIMIVAASVLFITLLAIVYILLRRGRELSAATSEVETEAFINDINNYTASSQYQLGTKSTMFGRVAGKDTAHLNYLVIPESTIGRRHALIEYKDYGFWISDQGSINGTFINDKMISSEVCLKHGDKVRLHKFEFEFTMPEMDDAGKTVMSGAVFTPPSDNADAATVLNTPESEIDDVSALESLEPEFDITGGADLDFVLEMSDEEESDNGASDTESVDQVADDDETEIRDENNGAEKVANIDKPEDESEDETLMPDSYDMGNNDGNAELGEETVGDEETLMRGTFEAEEDDEMTIRKESDEAVDDFFDIGGDEDNKT